MVLMLFNADCASRHWLEVIYKQSVIIFEQNQCVSKNLCKNTNIINVTPSQ